MRTDLHPYRAQPRPSPPIPPPPKRYLLILEWQAHISELTRKDLERLQYERGLSEWYHIKIQKTADTPALLIETILSAASDFSIIRPMKEYTEIKETIAITGEFYSRINGHEIRIIDTTRPRKPVYWSGIRGRKDSF